MAPKMRLGLQPGQFFFQVGPPPPPPPQPCALSPTPCPEQPEACKVWAQRAGPKMSTGDTPQSRPSATWLLTPHFPKHPEARRVLN